MACDLGIPRLPSAFCSVYGFLECAEHIHITQREPLHALLLLALQTVQWHWGHSCQSAAKQEGRGQRDRLWRSDLLPPPGLPSSNILNMPRPSFPFLLPMSTYAVMLIWPSLSSNRCLGHHSVCHHLPLETDPGEWKTAVQFPQFG